MKQVLTYTNKWLVIMRTYDPETHEPCKSAPHSGQELMTIDGFTFWADKALIPLLQALNDAGIQTYSHCAGHTPEAPTWVVLEAENLNIEVRQHLGRSQVVLSWEKR